MSESYRNPWFKRNGTGYGPERYETDAKPVQIGKYLRYHRISSATKGGNCYDFVLAGTCFAQRAGPATEAQIDSCVYAQGNLRDIFGAVPA